MQSILTISGDESIMPELKQVFAMQRKYIFFLLAICALGWGFTPYQDVFLGIALGSLFGLYNFWLLIRRMDKFDRALDQGKRASLGTGMRFASGVAAAAIAISLPEYFNLIATVIGLMIPYILLLVERIAFHVKNH
jgi:ATP synthase protein I